MGQSAPQKDTIVAHNSKNTPIPTSIEFHSPASVARSLELYATALLIAAAQGMNSTCEGTLHGEATSLEPLEGDEKGHLFFVVTANDGEATFIGNVCGAWNGEDRDNSTHVRITMAGRDESFPHEYVFDARLTRQPLRAEADLSTFRRIR